MTYAERKEYEYDTKLFARNDSQTALKIYDEYVRAYSAKPGPKFFEVDRENEKIDPLWQVPLGPRTLFTKRTPLLIPALNGFQTNTWKNSKEGRYVKRDDLFVLSHKSLIDFDYFPMAGDLVWWNGYRYQIVNISIPANGYWQQTNVWMGLNCECVIAPEGDAKPVADPSVPAISEISSAEGPAAKMVYRPKHEDDPIGGNMVM